MKCGAFNMIPKANDKQFAMETFDIPMTQESSHVEIINKASTHHLL
jgi:hypothetical protein